MTKALISAVALAFGGWAAGAQAQTPPNAIPAPRNGTAENGNPIWVLLTVGARGSYHAWDDPTAPLRDSSPLGNAHEWFPVSNPVIASILAEPARPLTVGVKLRLTAAGTIAACDFARPPQSALTPEAICDAVKRSVRFRPALGQDGKPIESQGELWLGRSEDRWSKSDTPPPLIQYQSDPSPAPPPPPPPPRLTKFPPDARWLELYSGPAAWRQTPLATPVAAGAPHAGIVVGSKASGMPGCTLVAPSGDSALDAQACRFADKVLKPKWPAEVEPRKQSTALLVGGSGEAMSAFRADGGQARGVRVVEGKAPELYRRVITITGPQPDSNWTAFGMIAHVDGEGRVVRCTVARSSGSDRGDIEACRLLSQGDWLAPATDVFGRPIAKAFFWWGAAEQKRLTGG